MRFRTAGAVLGLLMASALAGACSAPAQAPAPSSEPEVEPAAHDQTALEYLESKKTWACEPGKEHWRTEGTPRRGGTFVQGLSSFTHIDPTAPSGNSHYQPQVYEHLIETRACYYEDTAFVPGLATSWQVSQDGLTWTLKLRQDVKWQNLPPVNGRRFTSADVAWTIEHQKAGGQLRSAWETVQYATPDPYTVVLTLSEPNADFLGNVLGERLQFMMPHEVKETYGDFKAHAVGTGPFQLKEIVGNQRVSFVRNPDFREMGVDGKPLPYIDAIELPVFGDYSAEVAAMRSGQLDLNNVNGYLKPDSDSIMAALPRYKLYRDVAPIPRGFWFTLDRKPYDDPRVRKAIALGLDHDEIIEGGYLGGAIRTGYLPSAIIDYAWSPTKVRELLKPDRDEAKKLLADAGYTASNPLKFTIKTGQGPQDRAGAEVVQQQLKAIGVDAQIEVAPVVLIANVIPQRDYGAAWGGISPASIFPDRWMGGFLRCKDSRNYTNLCDPEIDRLSLAQGRELDVPKRKALLDQLQQRIHDQTYYIPTLSLIYYRIYNCRVKNMPSTEWTQQLTGIKSAWLDTSGC